MGEIYWRDWFEEIQKHFDFVIIEAKREDLENVAIARWKYLVWAGSKPCWQGIKCACIPSQNLVCAFHSSKEVF